MSILQINEKVDYQEVDRAINKMIINGDSMSLYDFKGRPKFTETVISKIEDIQYRCQNTLKDLRLIK